MNIRVSYLTVNIRVIRERHVLICKILGMKVTESNSPNTGVFKSLGKKGLSEIHKINPVTE